MTTTTPAEVPPSQAILTIAGSDPSGGAGIQADLKTFTAIGVYGAAAISCLTVQNTLGVSAVEPVSPELVAAQIKTVLADLEVGIVKTGLLPNRAVAEAVAAALASFQGEIVCDPVLRSGSGTPLWQGGLAKLPATPLFQRATVLTPNLPELAVLSGQECADEQQALAAGKGLLARLPNLRALVITGGHLAPETATVTDLLLLRQRDAAARVVRRRHPRRQSSSSHGTGCTFASALAGYLLLSDDYEQAFDRATALVDHLLQSSVFCRFGHGNGPLPHHLLCHHPEETP